MGLNDTPSGERLHIGFFGLRNAGKSSLVNAVTGQSVSVVSEVKGTTTDPVKKAMELLPLGPVLLIDTPGLDDAGALGAQRVQRAKEILRQTDCAVLVVDAARGLTDDDTALLSLLQERTVPYLIAYNKADLLPAVPQSGANNCYVSAATGAGIPEFKEKLSQLVPQRQQRRLVADLLSPGDTVVLVTPIDASAPKGRLILPQQQVMRDILDAHCTFAVCQPEELPATLSMLRKPPKLVITDSQAFARVSKDTPQEILLTSFSILFARYKGSLPLLLRGAERLSTLKDGDRVLISEGCTHHRQCGDIGTVKLPAWIRALCGASPTFQFTSGGSFPDDLSGFALVVHCGGCMLNENEMRHRMQTAKKAGVPMVNYGLAIAEMHGILKRSVQALEKGEQV